MQRVLGWFRTTEKTLYETDQAIEDVMDESVSNSALAKNPLDQIIVKHGDVPGVSEVYKARWVWYHTILAGLIFGTNILLSVMLLVLILILNKI